MNSKREVIGCVIIIVKRERERVNSTNAFDKYSYI